MSASNRVWFFSTSWKWIWTNLFSTKGRGRTRHPEVFMKKILVTRRGICRIQEPVWHLWVMDATAYHWNRELHKSITTTCKFIKIIHTCHLVSSSSTPCKTAELCTTSLWLWSKWPAEILWALVAASLYETQKHTFSWWNTNLNIWFTKIHLVRSSWFWDVSVWAQRLACPKFR